MKRIPWGNLLSIFATHYLIVMAATYAGQNLIAGRHGPLPIGETIVKGLTRWDGGWYLRIVENGYNAKSAAFFPLYPMLIKGISFLGVNQKAAGLLISAVAFLMSLIVLYKLFMSDYPEDVSLRALWYLAVAPTAFYFSALYTESLFLVLMGTCLLMGRKKKWWACGVFLLLAALTRSLGVFLLVPILWDLWRTREASSVLDKLNFMPLLKVSVPLIAGLSGYMYFLWYKLGNPLAFMTAQSYWRRQPAFPWSSILRAFEKVHVGNTWWNLLFTLVFLIILVVSLKQLPPVYLLYGFIGILVPLCTPALHSPLLSMPRFVVVLFPVYLALALKVRSSTAHNVLITVSVTGLIYFNMLFALARWVA
ncbi:MAG TPA: hypothetical protein VHS59_08980 [Bacillota bacterium]|nr:hypothetical protein [Bacillota bacterium]